METTTTTTTGIDIERSSTMRTTNNLRPVTIWHGDHSSGVSSSEPGWEFAEFRKNLIQDGAVIVESNDVDRPINHRMIGVGVSHDDALFAEQGKSMAAFYENGEDWGGLRWWETFNAPYYRNMRRYYDPKFVAEERRRAAAASDIDER